MFVLNLFFSNYINFRTKINTYLILFVTSICSILMILIHEGIAMITIPFIVFILKSKKYFKIYGPIIHGNNFYIFFISDF